MRRRDDAESIRPLLLGRRLVQLIDLTRILLGYSLTPSGGMSRGMAITVLLTKFAPAMVQKLWGEVSETLPEDAREKVESLARAIHLNLEGGDAANELSEVLKKQPQSGTSFTDSLKALSMEDFG